MGAYTDIATNDWTAMTQSEEESIMAESSGFPASEGAKEQKDAME